MADVHQQVGEPFLEDVEDLRGEVDYPHRQALDVEYLEDVEEDQSWEDMEIHRMHPSPPSSPSSSPHRARVVAPSSEEEAPKETPRTRYPTRGKAKQCQQLSSPQHSLKHIKNNKRYNFFFLNSKFYHI